MPGKPIEMTNPPKVAMKSKLNIGALNCQGLKEKIDTPQIYELISTEDIFGVSETWLKDGDDINLSGYKFYPFNRKKVKGTTRGGVGIFVREEIKRFVKIRYDLSCENIMWCKLDKTHFKYDDDVYVGVIYFPPQNSPREKRLNLDHFRHLTEICTKIDSNNIILMGDFNARTQNLDDTLTAEKHDSDIPENFYSTIKTKRSN